MAEPGSDRPTVAIAGATGFLGTALRTALEPDYTLIGLTRSPVRARVNRGNESGTEWRHCDLFEPYAVREALAGVDVVVYLVHSMLPTARLTQGQAADLDLLQADNVARAAESQGVKQILYLSALVPDPPVTLPPTLQRRVDVEQTLASRSVPLTSIRAGLIVGAGGTWLRLLLNLVRRLPVMILPSWTRAQTQPIARRDVVRGLCHCLGDPSTYGATYDLGGPDVMTYRDLLLRTANVLGLRRRTMTVPMESPGLSKLWVRVFGGAPWALVGPIIDSLRYQARVHSNPLQEVIQDNARSFEDALSDAVDDRGRPLPNPRDALRAEDDAVLREESRARSVHSMLCPPGYTVRDVADEYLRWLPRLAWPFLNVRVEGGRVAHFSLRPGRVPLLRLRFDPDHSPDGRQLFSVTGGRLVADADPSGRLEFREVLGGKVVLAAVHDFSPRLPWPVYQGTQALVHQFVMRRFRRHMERLTEGTGDRAGPMDAPSETKN